jgi:hypothetical protein
MGAADIVISSFSLVHDLERYGFSWLPSGTGDDHGASRRIVQKIGFNSCL